ncbi:MAG: family 16 glycoside hydrolase [Ktedonobacteraceae bacterium]
MNQNDQIIHISISASNQEMLRGFNHTVKLPGGEQVIIHVSSTASSDNGTALQKERDNLQHIDDSASVTTLPLTQIVSISTSEGQEKSPSVSKNKDEKEANEQSTRIRWQDHFEAAVIGILLGGLLTGIVLYVFGRLPGTLALIGSTLGAILALIAASWSVLNENIIQPIRKRWHFPQSFILSIICLVVVAGGLFWGTVGRADPYHHMAEPVFFDPLDNSQTDNYWFTGDFGQNNQQQKNNCDFHGQNYVVTAGYSDNNTNIAWCTATATNFDNFVYEVQMNITTRGSCGGIVFRADLAHSKYYLFELCSGQPTPDNPSYKLVRYDNTSTQSGYILIVNPKFNQSFVSNRFYTIAVVARGINFEMYVDHQMMNTVFDASSNALTQGQIGVAAVPNTSNSAQVDFRNAQVWAF